MISNINLRLEELVNQCEVLCDLDKEINSMTDEYEKIYRVKRCYLQNNKIEYLKKLIYLYLSIKDFRYAFFYIDKLIDYNECECSKYRNIKKELVIFLREIQDKVNLNCKKHIVLNWIDALEYDELKEMSYLKKIADDSLYFENAYTVSPWTRATMKTMFCKKKMVDDHQFEIGKLCKDNSVVIDLLDHSGYCFKYIGHEKGDVFTDELNINKQVDRPIPSILWDLVCDIYDNDKPTFYLVHSVYETHSPYINGKYIGDSYVNHFERASTKEQRVCAREYVDEQMEFYSVFYDRSQINIYMSDHGKIYDLYHTVLFIKNLPNEWNCKYESIFSLYDFFELCSFLLQPSKEKWEKIPRREYAEIQDTDKYGYTLYMRAVITGKSRIDNLLGYRGVRTVTDEFIRRNDGYEKYYLIGQKRTNLINEEKYQDRIKYLRQKAGTYSIDVNKYDEFIVSRYIYQAIERYNHRMELLVPKCEKIIKEIVNKFPQNVKIAFRGGAEHTEHLIGVMGEERNYVCVVDRDPDDPRNNFGEIPVIRPSDINDYEIDIMIISSYLYKNEMKDELKQMNKNFYILDFYEEFESAGLDVGQAYYGEGLLEVRDCQGLGFEQFDCSVVKLT